MKIIIERLRKIWFYTLVGIITILISPVLLILTLNDRWYAVFFWVAKYLWSYPIMYGMFFIPKVKAYQNQQKGKSYMYIANHTSMIDIMLMFIVAEVPFVFVGKKELARMPVFGYFYRKFSILVDRSNASSRKAVYTSAQQRLDRGLSICIFPEGKVPEEDVFLDTFKDGAFRLAIQYHIPIVPIVFPDNKKRFPYSLQGSCGDCRAIVYPFLQTQGLDLERKEDVVSLKNKARQVIFDGLNEYGYV